MIRYLRLNVIMLLCVIGLVACKEGTGEVVVEKSYEELVLEYLNEKYGEDFELAYSAKDDMLAASDKFGATVVGHNDPEDYFTVYASEVNGIYKIRDNYYQQLVVDVYAKHMEELLLQVVETGKFNYILGESATADTANSKGTFEDIKGTGFSAAIQMIVPESALGNKGLKSVMEEMSQLVIDDCGEIDLSIFVAKDDSYDQASFSPDDNIKGENWRNQFVSMYNNLLVNNSEIVYLDLAE